MRYYFVSQTSQNPLFRWLNFPGKRAWLDLEDPRAEGLLLLAGSGAGAVRPVLHDPDGKPVALQISDPGEDLPDNAKWFLRQPEDQRWLKQVSFRFPGAVPLTLSCAATGQRLAVLTPGMGFPAHLFSLLQRAPHGPDGRWCNFVETGTLFGHTTLHASYWADRVITIELSQTLHAEAVKHLAHRPNVTCLQGNSADVLAEVVPDLDGPSVFYLDAHWSGDSSVDWGSSKFNGYPIDTARAKLGESEGARQVPLMEELTCILDDHRDAATIVIDDWHTVGTRDLNFAGEDWTHLDRDALLSLMDGHARSLSHSDDGPNRHVWHIGPL
ncbi:hypothetical protein J4E08_22535 [Sagittula sp. NFXS13]|uniref:hypothetical protein n=1 Tax=Sagittula sp. NFXS13 TaxID=2819095 RepID=UPI0032DE91E1